MCLCGGVLAGSGCARRAYTDLYVENMAAEIRDLEDQLYEFDDEYRIMEHELDAMQAKNARLESLLASATAKAGSPNTPSSPGATPRLLPVPNSGAASSGAPGSPSVAPSLDVTPPATSSSSPSGSSPSSSPTPAAPLGKQPNPLAPSTLPPPKSTPGQVDPYDLKNLQPPTIEPGEAMPPSLPGARVDPASPVTLHSQNDLEVELGQITLPAQFASVAHGDALPVGGRVLQPSSGMPDDTRIVEMKFHPSLSRAVNLDEQGEDDGLYLVLQPLNESGQFVPVAAELMILAIDLSQDEKHANIGRWTFSSSDVKSKLQPIGSSQGIHLSLPFSGPAPQCDRVLVFVYYTLPDGRRIVAEQEVMLNNNHRQSTVWVPRARSGLASSTPPLQTVSGVRPAK